MRATRLQYVLGRGESTPSRRVAREREALGVHNPRAGRGRHVEDGMVGFLLAEHPCAMQRPTRNHVRLVSGVAGKLTVAASRPPWITMERLACSAASRD
jgi:hypothetical protein